MCLYISNCNTKSCNAQIGFSVVLWPIIYIVGVIRSFILLLISVPNNCIECGIALTKVLSVAHIVFTNMLHVMYCCRATRLLFYYLLHYAANLLTLTSSNILWIKNCKNIIALSYESINGIYACSIRHIYPWLKSVLVVRSCPQFGYPKYIRHPLTY